MGRDSIILSAAAISFPLSSVGTYPLWDKIAVVPPGLGFNAGI